MPSAREEDLLRENDQFIIREASKAAGKIITRSDEEYSIALAAFWEAIKRAYSRPLRRHRHRTSRIPILPKKYLLYHRNSNDTGSVFSTCRINVPRQQKPAKCAKKQPGLSQSRNACWKSSEKL